jgi:hypothetical protein
MALQKRQQQEAPKDEQGGNGQGNKPDWSKRVFSDGGYVEVAIFSREVEGNGGGTFTAYSVVCKRSWKAGEKWESGHSFRPADCLVLCALLQEAWTLLTNEAQKK